MAYCRGVTVLVLLAVLLTVAPGPLAAAADDSRPPRQPVQFKPTAHHLISEVADSMHLGTARLLSWPQPKLAGSSSGNSSSNRKLLGINKIQVTCNPRYSKWC